MDKSNNEISAIERFRTGADQLSSLLAGMSEPQMDLTLGEGEWSIRQIVHHLSDDGDVYGFVVKRAIGSPGSPTRFEGFPGNEVWSDRLCSNSRPVKIDLQLICTHRQSIAELVSTVPEAFEKKAVFIGEDGKSVDLYMADMLNMLSDHMDEHLETIRKIKANHQLA